MDLKQLLISLKITWLDMIDNNLIEKIYKDDRRSIARAISIVESDNSFTSEYLK